MKLPHSSLVLAFALSTAAAALAVRPSDPSGPAAPPCPFAAHNAYPYKGDGENKFSAALAAGLKSVEVDETWDPNRRAAVVTHDEKPKGDEPELGAFLATLFRKWQTAPGTGYILVLDLKSSDPNLPRAIHAVLERHAKLLSKMSAGPVSASSLFDSASDPFEPGKITVWMSGSGDGKDAYRRSPPGGVYLAFGDRVFNENDYKKNVADYFPKAPPAFERFITMHVQNCMAGAARKGFLGKAEAKLENLKRHLPFMHGYDSDDTLSATRAAEIASKSRASGYPVRLYVVNGGGIGDHKGTSAWDLLAKAGIPWIATDDYAQAAAWWKGR
ncbi:MAG: hypothetical protein HY303_03035 [Candidatus Wallbacteria bacterium]|nr:hypothetical protein [Candidatus Wallbacteria bacterium]